MAKYNTRLIGKEKKRTAKQPAAAGKEFLVYFVVKFSVIIFQKLFEN